MTPISHYTIPRVLPGMRLTEHVFHLPLNHDEPGGEEIEVFAREVTRAGAKADELPWLVFLQGGPGFPAQRPITLSGWLEVATKEHRVLLLDQRGTGRSTPATFQSLSERGSPAEQADYLKRMRADSIVADAELIRRKLAGDEPWTLLGQSFGGFCATHYLSRVPEGLAGAVITGGLPPLSADADEIYTRTYPIVAERNRRYYERYPEDVDRIRSVVDCLLHDDVRLPGGDRLTPRRFQQLGLHLGMSDGAEIVHYLVDEAFVPGEGHPRLSYTFLKGFEHALAFDTNPLFSILHEACYAQEAATNWAAERKRAEHPEFDVYTDGPVFFTGEMIYPWMFEEIATLRPLRKAAEILAAHDGWPRLYDADVLKDNDVPVVAAIYAEDMYVERDFSEETARSIRGLRPWVTNEFQHDGLRNHGAKVLTRLLDLLHGRA